jgi:hypothetical protein
MKTTGFFEYSAKTTTACLFVAALAVGFSGCADIDNSVQETDGTQTEISYGDKDEPTTDQMKVSVTANVPAAVLSRFDDNSTGAAFVKRLPLTTSAIDEGTRLVVVKGSDALTIPTSTIEGMANVILNGGYLAIETPSNLNMAEFASKFAVALLKKQNEYYANRFLVGGAQARIRAEESTEVERLKTRVANVAKVAQTRSGITDKLTATVAELLIFSSNQYFMQEAFKEEQQVQTYAIDDDGNRTDNNYIVKIKRNGFRNGEMADAAAEWINNVEKEREEKVTNAARAFTRADAKEAINELMDPSETFTFYGNMAFRDWDNDWFRRTNRVKQVIRSWGVHAMDNNKDYYYIKQNVTLSMGDRDGYKMFYPKATENIWSSASNYGGSEWHLWYGAFLSKYETSMELTGNGNIFVEAAMPETKNSGTTKSVSMGTSHSTTETVGITWSGSGYNQPGWGGNLTVGGNWSKGWTDSRSFNVGYSRNIEDLTVSKNANGNKVSWTYNGNKPEGYVAHDIYGADYTYCHHTAPEILVSDADLLNEICWSVENPDGQYTIEIYSKPETAALMESSKSSKNKIKTKYEYTPCDENNNFSHELLQPNRALQTWRMNIIIDEWENGVVSGALGEIEKYITKSYPDVYQNVFTVADKTPTSVQVINANIEFAKNTFTNAYDILQGLAHSYGVKRFTIHWRCDDRNITVKEGFTVETETSEQPDQPDQPTVKVRFDKDTDNTDLIAHYAGRKANVTLGGRRFIKDGTWNTFTVPFDIDDFDGTPLADASVRELKSVECSGNTMTLKFGAVATIKAHKPYIVRWDEGDDVQNPVFNGVTIQDGKPVKVTMTNGNEEVIAFVGVYDPLTLRANDHNKLYFGADNKLCWPSDDVPVYAHYAYFQLYNTTFTNVVIR